MVGVKISKSEFFDYWTSAIGPKDLQRSLLGRFGLNLSENDLSSFEGIATVWAKKFACRWKKCARNKSQFLRANGDWLKGDIILIQRNPNLGERPRKPFCDLSERNKLLRAKKWMTGVSLDQLKFAAEHFGLRALFRQKQHWQIIWTAS